MRLVLDARARAFLRRVSASKVYTGVELLLIAMFAVQCARLVWVVVTPVGPVGVWRPEQAGIGGDPRTILRGFDPFFRLNGGDAAGPAVVTDLQLTLYGTRIDEAQGRAAIIAGADGVQQSIAVGQPIMPGVTLKAVYFDHVTIDRGRAAQDLFLAQPDKATPAPPPMPGAPLIGGNPIQPSTGPSSPAGRINPQGLTLTQLRSDVGFIPRIDKGRVSGLAVRAQGSGVGFRAAGLHDGDVITAIGGRPVTGPADLERLGAQYAKGGTLAVAVERGSDTIPLVITIAGQ